jgi:2,3-bisphosphoglycerate-independent phosphoglycerate mutase
VRETPDRILLIFLDGVGLGDDDPRTNPLVTASLPVLRELLGGAPLVRGSEASVAPGSPARLAAVDATLGVAGLPQSGTGQTTLLTGRNAPALLGRHFGPWVHTTLRPMLAATSVLRRAVDAGRSVAFANAYPARYIADDRVRRRPAAPPFAAEAAGVLTRDSGALREGRAVASSITHDAWREHVDASVPRIGAGEAGKNLARISAGVELTLFAHYDTDIVGHRGDLLTAVRALELVDEFLGGVLAELSPGTLLLVASDHGNIEDASAGHTLNPIPLLAVGPGRDEVAERAKALSDVAPAILDLLNITDSLPSQS